MCFFKGLRRELRDIKIRLARIEKGIKMTTENLDAVKEQMKSVTDLIVTVDETVENLYEAVTTGKDDITPELRDVLLEGLGTMRKAVEKVATKDRVTPPPVEPPA